MNIFATSDCPIKCAKFLDDATVKEMAKETARILTAALRLDTAYGTYNVYHPCIVWARLNRANYEWLLEHFRALCEEYEIRYRVPAKANHLYQEFKKHRSKLPLGTRTPFVNQSKFKGISDVHLAYRSDLAFRWVSYKKAPTWYNKLVKPQKEPWSELKSKSA